MCALPIEGAVTVCFVSVMCLVNCGGCRAAARKNVGMQGIKGERKREKHRERQSKIMRERERESERQRDLAASCVSHL